MWKRKKKKSEGQIARIKNTEPAIRHPNEEAMKWMRRKLYDVHVVKRGDASAEQNEI